MPQAEKNHSRRLSFLGLIAWLSVCLLAAGLLPQHGVALNSIWIFAGLFGLVSAVGLSQAVKTEINSQQALLDTYIAEARTDPLTGIANRRAFDMELRRLCQQYEHAGEPLSLMLLDVDRFKQFNDSHGHQAGDEMLRALAGVLRRTVDGAGLTCRYGGEEFAVILPAIGLQAASSLAERLRLAVVEQHFDFRGATLHVTISIGIAQAELAERPENLVRRADGSLYAAKQGGRDCIYVDDVAGPRRWYDPATESFALV